MNTEETELKIDKSAWPDGPWKTEPDKLQWIDEATKLDCLIVRGPHGGLCGYVGVPETHRYFGQESGSIDADIEVHGGLTYSDKCTGHICHIPEAGRPDNVWWFGFDCAHIGDFSPAYQELGISWKPEYRDVEYVKSECSKLAAQLVKFS